QPARSICSFLFASVQDECFPPASAWLCDRVLPGRSAQVRRERSVSPPVPVACARKNRRHPSAAPRARAADARRNNTIPEWLLQCSCLSVNLQTFVADFQRFHGDFVVLCV